MSDVTTTVIDWIKQNCLKDKPGMDVTAETPLLASDILDSLDFLSLVVYLNEKFGIEIDEDDMSPDNFETPTTITELIVSLKSS